MSAYPPVETPAPGRAPQVNAWSASAAAFLLFLATWSGVHSWDSIAFTARAHDDPLLSDTFLSTTLLHPHHLLYVPLAKFFVWLTQAWTVYPFAPLLLLNSLAGAGVAGLGGWLAERASGKAIVGRAATAILMLSNTTWLYSTLVEVMMPALCFLLIGGVALTVPTRRGALVGGLAVAAGILLHQIVAFYAIVLSVLLVVSRDRRALIFTLAWIVPAGLAYLAAAIGYGGARSVSEVLAWPFASGAAAERFPRGLTAAVYESARTGAEGLVSLVPLSRLRTGDTEWTTVLGAIAALLVLAGASLGLWRAARSRPAAGDPRARTVTGALLLGSALVALFVSWFTARTIDFWVYVVASAAIWACGRAPRVPVVAFAAWLVMLATVNLGFRVVPMRNPANAPYADLSRFAASHFQAGDRLWIGPGDEALVHAPMVLPFFHRVEVKWADAPEVAPPAAGRTFATETALPALAAADSLQAEEVGTLRSIRVYRLAPASSRAAPNATSP